MLLVGTWPNVRHRGRLSVGDAGRPIAMTGMSSLFTACGMAEPRAGDECGTTEVRPTFDS
jgi:hypothetical protein